MLRHYATADVDPASRLTYWQGLCDRNFSRLDITPDHRREFDASFSIDSLGPLTLARSASTPARMMHFDCDRVPDVPHRFVLLYTIRGRVELEFQRDRQVLIGGDLILLDRAQPYRIICPVRHEAIVVQMPESAARQHLPRPEEHCRRVVGSRDGIGNTLAALTRSVWQRVEEGIPDSAGQYLANGLLEITAAAFASQFPGPLRAPPLRTARRLQIKRYIEQNLRDSDLNVERIAPALGMSPRYVRMLFTDEKETVSAYILRRRLEVCAAQMVSPLARCRTITAVAFDWGFSNAAHFSRVFRRHFGVSPTEYRRMNSVEE